MTAAEPTDVIGPPVGPCAACGAPDARHRVFDAIVSRWRGGDAIEDLAEDYGLPAATVRRVVTGSP